jgi:magnesium-protoporphyrin O-methyltransferase
MAMTWDQTRDRVHGYFDRTATEAWAKLTSDAKVSSIRETVRAGRDEMRALILSRLPGDLTGTRVLDAGCGAGQTSAELAARGAEVVGVDISPALIGIARDRLPAAYRGQVTFAAGDMLAPDLGRFDHVVAMDSLIYYTAEDIAAAIGGLAARTGGKIVFTVAPRTPFLMAFWAAGQVFPRSDRSPTMIPHSAERLARVLPGRLTRAGRISRGFYISECLEVAP